MSKRKVRESAIETLFREGVEALGGKAYKFVSPGEAGVYDRIVVLPYLPVHFVELKRPGRDLDPLQVLFRDYVAERGHPHAMLDSAPAVATWLAERAREIARRRKLS